MATLEAIRYAPGTLSILDQLKLPHTTEYNSVGGVEDGWAAIREMRVL